MPQFAITPDLDSKPAQIESPASVEKMLDAASVPDLPSLGLVTTTTGDRILLKAGTALLMSGKTDELTTALDTYRPNGQGFVESETSRPQICVAGARRGRISKHTVLVIFGAKPDQPSLTGDGWTTKTFKSPMDLDLLIGFIEGLKSS